MNTKEGRLIAEFMGWTIEPGMEDSENPYYNYADGWKMIMASQMQFNTSLDWLMPVIQKIESTGISTHIDTNYIHFEGMYNYAPNSSIKYRYVTGTYDDPKINAVYGVVLDFINHYNNSTKKP